MRERQVVKMLEGPPPADKLVIRYTGRRWVVEAAYGPHVVTGESGANLALAFWDLKLRLEEFNDIQ